MLADLVLSIASFAILAVATPPAAKPTVTVPAPVVTLTTPLSPPNTRSAVNVP